MGHFLSNRKFYFLLCKLIKAFFKAHLNIFSTILGPSKCIKTGLTGFRNHKLFRQAIIGSFATQLKVSETQDQLGFLMRRHKSNAMVSQKSGIEQEELLMGIIGV